MQRFDLAVERTAPDVIVHLAGELDVASVIVLHRSLGEIRDLQPREVVLDVRNLRFIDARGVHGLRREAAMLRCRGHRVRTVNLRASVRRVTRLLAAEQHLGAE